MATPIVDSHIHLFPASHLSTLAWHGPDSPLASQHSIDEYRAATSSVPTDAATATNENKYLRGIIFLETDRISSIAEESTNNSNPGWKHALDEVSLLTRIALGEPVDGEGHKAIDRDLCLGIVPWAPVPGGPTVLQSYMDKVQQRTKTDEVWHKVRGVRYLVQDKPGGVMLEPGFVEGLRWLGKKGLAFDLGVDARQGGLHQLREAVEMMNRVYRGMEANDKQAVTIVINHLCKPNLRISVESTLTHVDFLEWKDMITQMARASNKTYMKLSGAFSELSALNPDSTRDIQSSIDTLKPWTDVIFDAFGINRVMFGSDWPVCNIGGGGNEISWNKWTQVVEGILDQRNLTEDEQRGIWGQVALQAYGIDSI
ncbi:amidohydrolase family protein [Penicillium angulare]|uniref:amidohydrolase family protein n=1 Tax=Penicillium angulare TaxID=116970 RepID=UPI002540F183|nr:amidohydrolase family protein [Penicillium angulare]KAJ5266534.1 amidohydrolase family protein [Penicillium angulare]